jgi:two-component system chemotaxis response regulator CheB
VAGDEAAAPRAQSTIRVLIVDDSAVARAVLARLIEDAPGMSLAGHARTGRDAVAQAARLRPDVITMDIRMPDMDGYEATRAIMAETPTPIIVVSAHEPDAVASSFRALDAGAVSVLTKPGLGSSSSVPSDGAALLDAIRAIAGLRQVTRRRPRTTPSGPATVRPGPPTPDRAAAAAVVAIGASTGGPAALSTILRALPADFPVPILVVQHIAQGFDTGLVSWLDSISSLHVLMATEGHEPCPGQVVVAPNGRHLGVTGRRSLTLTDGEPIDSHRPAATYLFRSVAEVYGPEAVGVILTGIGRDGSAGLAMLHERGGLVIAQDERSSAVYGMPRAVVEGGHAHRVASIEQIAAAISAAVSDPGAARR